jgi:hypothetical protein
MEGKNCNDNNLDAEFAKGAEFRRGRTGNGKGLNAEGAEGFPVEKNNVPLGDEVIEKLQFDSAGCGV